MIVHLTRVSTISSLSCIMTTVHGGAVWNRRSLSRDVRDVRSGKHELTIVDVSLRDVGTKRQGSMFRSLLRHAMTEGSTTVFRDLAATRGTGLVVGVGIGLDIHATKSISKVVHVFRSTGMVASTGGLIVHWSLLGLVVVSVWWKVAVHLSFGSNASGVVEVGCGRPLAKVGNAHGRHVVSAILLVRL